MPRDHFLLLVILLAVAWIVIGYALARHRLLNRKLFVSRKVVEVVVVLKDQGAVQPLLLEVLLESGEAGLDFGRLQIRGGVEHGWRTSSTGNSVEIGQCPVDWWRRFGASALPENHKWIAARHDYEIVKQRSASS